MFHFTKRRGRVSRATLPVFLAALLVVPFPSSATGDHGGRPVGALFSCDRPVMPPRCTSVADNPRHLVHFDATLTEELRASMRDAMSVYGATELVLFEQPRRTRMTDVIAFSQDYGDNGAAGWVYCPSDAPQGTNPSGDRWCRQQELHLNLNPRYAVFFADDASRDHVACHELGHTVGLRHWGNPPQTAGEDLGATCMNANTPNGPTTLHQFDIDHINGYAYRQRQPQRHRPLMAPSGEQRTRLMPWSGTLEATQIDAPASLRELTRSADVVVRGRIVAVQPGRVFGDPNGTPLHYASATLRVDERLAGTDSAYRGATLTLEIPLFDGPESIERLSAWGEAVYFLRKKDGAGLYRLVTFSSLIVNVDESAVVDPEAPYLEELFGLPFGSAADAVRSAGR